jgi:magnesium-transporting ATPase (P-type)
VLFNSTAFVENENGRQVVKGNATEVGLINYFLESGNVDNLISNKNQTGFQIFEIPFDSNRKMATSVVLHNGTRRVFVKGAPEFVI